MYDKWSGRSRRFAFVTMKTVEDANAAIVKLNETVRFAFRCYLCKYNKFLEFQNSKRVNSYERSID